MKNQIVGFDILKFMMALLIVSIHIPVKNEYLGVFQGMGVPVFFVLSSYFVFRKAQQVDYSNNILTAFIKRIGTLYLFWFIANIYFIHIDKHYIQKGIMGGGFLVRDILFNYTYPGSWFLSALIIAVVIVFLLKKAGISNIFIMIIAIVIYIMLYNYKYLPDDYQQPFNVMKRIFRPELSLTFLMAIPWVSLGFFISSNNFLCYMKKVNNLNFICFAIFTLSLIISFLCRDITYIMRILAVLSILILAYNTRLVPNNRYLFLRKASILFFFLHFPIIKLLSITNIYFPHSLLKYMFVLAVCGLLSSLILTLAKRRGFSWLKFAF